MGFLPVVLTLTLNVLKGDKTDSLRRDGRKTERSSTCTWTTGGDEEQDLKLKLDPVLNLHRKLMQQICPISMSSSTFSEIDYNYPVESSRVVPQVQIFLSLFRITEKPARLRETSSNLTTYRLSLYLFLSLSPF